MSLAKLRLGHAGTGERGGSVVKIACCPFRVLSQVHRYPLGSSQLFVTSVAGTVTLFLVIADIH